MSKGKEKEEKKDKKEAGKAPAEPAIKPRLISRYKQRAVPALMQRFGYKNVMEVPRISKIAINIGMGAATGDSKLIDEAVNCLRDISGQKPVITRAKKAISNFKLRENAAIGCKVTLRGNRMWEFFDRLVSITIPRIRDFRGLPRKAFDGRGNYTLGIKEQIVFLEIDRDKVSRIHGMDLTICTTAKTDDEGRALLEEMGMPFRKDDKKDKPERAEKPKIEKPAGSDKTEKPAE